MRKIVDANYFSDPRLSSYLSKRRGNKVVLNEYAMIEAYKGNALKNVVESHRVLSQYPDQVIVLNGMRHLISVNGDPKGLQRRFIDKISTRDFGRFCQNVQQAAAGDSELESQILEYGRQASERIATMDNGAAALLEYIAAIKGHYSRDELKDFRVNGIVSGKIHRKLTKQIVLLFAILYRDHPDTSGSPNGRLIPNLYLLRLSTCWCILALRWLAFGGSEDVRRDRLVNDMVDVNYVAAATYFDGILTRDKNMLKLYDDAVYCLKHIFV